MGGGGGRRWEPDRIGGGTRRDLSRAESASK